ncbi:hypothetical protein TRFO_37869 [Tritrichomonas foetus]|uniref:COPI associated protein n=1 Tax=Tritrichomonas foetus TaxID=1144522 RepID=A0A1J4J9V7_9EUKA|nr:hypothetical protein TRFO_37869 [Tritrichomonas foetus]|eukprot:OHS95974.1 hypothetical protein TRFO_37869 [Tritrichomonas foetus]
MCEVYIFAFFKYFGFLLKPWGKALMYLFVGALLFQKNGFELFCGIIYWALAVVFCVMGFLIKQMPPPLMQGGLKGGSPPDITIDANAIYEGGEKGSGGGNKSTLYQGINDDV